MDFAMRLRQAAQVGFALGFGLYLAAHLFGVVATRAGVGPWPGADPISAGPPAALGDRNHTFEVTDVERVTRLAQPRPRRVITRTS